MCIYSWSYHQSKLSTNPSSPKFHLCFFVLLPSTLPILLFRQSAFCQYRLVLIFQTFISVDYTVSTLLSILKLYLFACLFTHLFKGQSVYVWEREWQRKKSSLFWFTSQMATTTGAGPVQSQESGTPFGSPMWLVICCCSLRSISRALDRKWSSWDWNLWCEMGCGHLRWQFHPLYHKARILSLYCIFHWVECLQYLI